MGESTHTAPGMLPAFPGVHAIAVAPGCRTQLHLGVKAQLTGPGYQPEQLTADVVADVVGLAVPVQARQFAGHPGPGPTGSTGSAPGMGSHTATASETTSEAPEPPVPGRPGTGGWPERTRSVSRRYRPQAGVLRCLDQAVVITDDRIKVRAENASGGKVDRVQ